MAFLARPLAPIASPIRPQVAYGTRMSQRSFIGRVGALGALLVAGAGAAWFATRGTPDVAEQAPAESTADAEPELAIGAEPVGERLARMQASPQWGGARFANPQPLWNSSSLTLEEMGQRPAHSTPKEPVPVQHVDPSLFDEPPPTGLRVTWLGHSTTLVEIDGVRILTDPVWGEFAGPTEQVGVSRWYPPLLPLEQLPKLDAVIISHDHYDHLDTPTIVGLSKRDVVFIAPLGVGAHLEHWGVSPERIVELDWWGHTSVGELEITCTPARHASGRALFDQNRTLWAGYALRGPAHRVYFSGDTGLFPDMKLIGERLGPFDLAMIEVGAYGRGWPDWHIGPEQAVTAHGWVGGKVLLPIHWGLFDLSAHGWTEPIERVVVAAKNAGVTLVSPRPGGSFEPSHPPALERWWPELPWRTAEQAPIVSTKLD